MKYLNVDKYKTFFLSLELYLNICINTCYSLTVQIIGRGIQLYWCQHCCHTLIKFLHGDGISKTTEQNRMG
jgi:hypothetical protein